MTRELFEQTLALLTYRQDTKTTELAEEYRRDLLDLQSKAILYYEAGGQPSLNALSVLSELRETGFDVLLSTISKQKPALSPTFLVEMVKSVGFAEAAVVKRLKAALTDARRVPQPPARRVHEHGDRPDRVCDEAYIGLRRLLHSESQSQSLAEADHFLSLPEADKNREIESFMSRGKFTQFLGEVDEEE